MGQVTIFAVLVFFPIFGGFLGYGIAKRNASAGDCWAIAVTALELAAALTATQMGGTFSVEGILGQGMHFKGGGFRTLLTVLTAMVWFLVTVFSKEYFAQSKHRSRYLLFSLMIEGATMGVFLAADFFTMFLFFEGMSLASVVLVIQEETKAAVRAAQTYLAVAVLGGLVTLMGIFLLYQKTGTLEMDAVGAVIAQSPERSGYYGIGGLLFFGFAAKAGLVPLHVWLPNAYTEAPAPASALLSCVLSKTGVFGAMVLTAKVFAQDAVWGSLMLTFGILTMLWGGILAVFSVNLKRTLACSSMSQVGFLMVGIGMQGLLGEENAWAVAGTILHFWNHSLWKLMLFLAAGVIYLQVRDLDLNRIKGFGREKPLLKITFLMAVLGISGIPLWNGYISKTLLHESMVEYIHLLEMAGQSAWHMRVAEGLFLLAGGLTLAYMTKIFVAVFVDQGNSCLPAAKTGVYLRPGNQMIFAGCGIFLLILGMLPHQTQERLAAIGMDFFGTQMPEHTIAYATWANLKGAVISIWLGAAIYLCFVRMVLMRKDENGETVYLDRWPKWLNLEESVYRPLLLSVLPFIGAFFARVAATLTDGCLALLRMFLFNSDNAKVIPPEDQYFSIYTDGETDKTVYREGFARSLLLIGLGITVAMLYLLF